MNVASKSIALLFFCNAAHAATVFTQSGRIDGVITRQNDKEVAVQPKAAAEIVIPRTEILTVYDDEGHLLWSHPSIVQNDPTPEAATKIELTTPAVTGVYRGLHLGLMGSFGAIWPSALFSTFPLGTTPGYNYAFEISSSGAWYYANDQAVTFGLGYARRNLSISGIIEGGNPGNGYWPMDYLDVRFGHRWHSGIFFLEPGLLTAVNLTDAPLTVTTSTGTQTNAGYQTPVYLALYLSLGANFPLTRQVFGLCAVRVEHAISAAVSGDAPTASDVTGKILSTAPINLVPFSVSIQVGATWRLDLPAGW